MPSSKGFTGVLTTPIADVLPENEGVLTFGKIVSVRKVTGIQSFFGFAEVGGSITGDPGDLGLNVKWLLPVWQRPDYRLSVAWGGVDIGGGRVMDRYFYGVTSLSFEHVRLTVGATNEGKTLAGVEIEPLIPWARLLITESEIGMALMAPSWGSVQMATHRKTPAPRWQIALQRPLDSLWVAPPTPQGNWNLHYELKPELFDVVAVETGPYHYQALLAHQLFLRGLESWRLGIQVRQPLAHSKELEPGQSLARFREEGVALRQSAIAYRLPMPFAKPWHFEASVGTYNVDWWFWRLSVGASYSQWSIQSYVAYFDNPSRDEYKLVWLPSLTWKTPQQRYGVRVYGGDFWLQDRGWGVSVMKYLGSATVSLNVQRITDDNGFRPGTFIGASFQVPLCLPRDIALGSKHFTANGPKSLEYSLSTRLITPGSSNTVAPLQGYEPDWLLRTEQ